MDLRIDVESLEYAKNYCFSDHCFPIRYPELIEALGVLRCTLQRYSEYDWSISTRVCASETHVFRPPFQE